MNSRVAQSQTTIGNLEALDGYFVPAWNSSAVQVHDLTRRTRTKELRSHARTLNLAQPFYLFHHNIHCVHFSSYHFDLYFYLVPFVSFCHPLKYIFSWRNWLKIRQNYNRIFVLIYPWIMRLNKHYLVGVEQSQQIIQVYI